MSSLSNILEPGVELLRMCRDYFWYPQELRKIYKQQTLNQHLMKVAGLAGLFLILPFIKVSGYVSSGGSVTQITSSFWNGLLFEFSVLGVVLSMAAVFAALHWFIARLAGESFGLTELFLFAVCNMGVLIVGFLVFAYAVMMLQQFNVLDVEWPMRLFMGAFVTLYFYSLAVHIINFPPHRSAIWSMALLSIPAALTFPELILDI